MKECHLIFGKIRLCVYKEISLKMWATWFHFRFFFTSRNWHVFSPLIITRDVYIRPCYHWQLGYSNLAPNFLLFGKERLAWVYFSSMHCYATFSCIIHEDSFIVSVVLLFCNVKWYIFCKIWYNINCLINLIKISTN